MSSQRLAELLLVFITIIWGSTFVVTKSLLDEVSPFWYTTIRFFLAAILLFLFFSRRILWTSYSAAKSGTILGVFLFVGFALQTVGLQYTTASKSAFFTGMLVVLTPIVYFIAQNFFNIKKKSLKVGNVFGAMVAAVGLFFMTSPSGGGFNIGDGLTLLCALMFAFYIVYLDTVPAQTDKMQMTFVMFLICGLIAFLCAVIFENLQTQFSTEFITALLYLTIFATVITMAIQNRYQGYTTPTRAAVIFALEPVFAAVFAYFVRGEVLGAMGSIGGMIVILGVLSSEFSDEIPLLNKVLMKANDDL